MWGARNDRDTKEWVEKDLRGGIIGDGRRTDVGRVDSWERS